MRRATPRGLLKSPSNISARAALVNTRAIPTAAARRLAVARAVSTMSTDAADSDGELHARSQQSPLASRRGETQTSRKGRFDNLFPMGYKQGFSQWWASIPADVAERRIFSFIPSIQPSTSKTGSEPPSINPSSTTLGEPLTQTPSIKDPYGPRKWYSKLVPLSGRDRALNEFSVERTEEPPAENSLVILHGYGAGLGFFYQNFEPLSRAKGWHLYALDMLGMGRSARPPFRVKSKTREEQISEAEAWFVDSLEEWRIKRRIDKMTLVAHSMGGYMATCYALKYPGRLNKLILVSPVGIPEDPYAVSAAMPEPPESSFQNEFTQDQATEASQPSQQPNANRIAVSNNADSSNPNEPPRRPIPKWLTYLWDANISPFSLVRWSGPLGPRLVSGWSTRRFSHLPPDEALALHDYAYSLFRLRGSGEYALAYILAPGAFARSPLIRRIQDVGRQPLSQNPRTDTPLLHNPSITTSSDGQPLTHEPGLPVVLMYGENDWMDVKGGYAAKKKIEAQKQLSLADKSEEDRKRDQGSAKVVIVKKAGHNIHLDNAEEFNDVIRAEMDDVERRQASIRSWF